MNIYAILNKKDYDIIFYSKLISKGCECGHTPCIFEVDTSILRP